jgi:predicted neuraminidase
MSLRLLICILCIFPLPLQADDSSAILKSEFIYETAPFPSCHASTIVETERGLVTAWFGGTYEKHPDVGIWVSRHPDGSWSPPVEVANGVQPDGTRHPTWNPVLFQPTSGPLMLFYKVGPDPRTWWGMLITSEDCGLTWSPPTRLPDGILGPIKNKPLQLPNGDILCPSSTESIADPATGNPDEWRIHFERTSDLGKTWSKVSPSDPNGIDAIQPSILVLGDNRLLALGRTRRGERRLFQVVSEDAGVTWGKMEYGMLPNPSSGTDAVTLRDGRHLLIYNHTDRGRSPINLALSADGMQWNPPIVLERDPGQEFSYPAIIQTADGLVHMTYTWHRKKIRHLVADPAKLETGLSTPK